MLGVRTAAMALRTWQLLAKRPVYSYQSLAFAAHAEWHRRPRAFAVIADARRDTWHCLAIGADGRSGQLNRIATAGLPSGELLMPEHFKQWSTLAVPVGRCRYDLAATFGPLAEINLFRPCETPDAFQHEAPEYKKWSAEIHSSESAKR